MTDERYRQLISLTKPPHNIDIYQVLMQAVNEATYHERQACANIARELSASNSSDANAYEQYAEAICARSNF